MSSKCGHTYSTTTDASDTICERDPWRGHDECIWHADDGGKPFDELKRERKDDPEKLDGAILRDVNSGSVNNSQARLLRKGETPKEGFKVGTSPIDFSNCSLKNATFENSRIMSTIFDGADLSGATFKNSDLHSSFFNDANLSDVKFNNSSFDSSEFEGACLNFASLCKSHFHRVDFEDASLTGLSVDRSHIARSNFKNCSLDGARISDVTAYEVNIESTIAVGMEISDSDFKRSSIEGLSGERIEIRDSNFIGSTFIGNTFDISELSRVDFTGADVSNSIFFESSMDDIDFSSASLHNAEFKKTKLNDIQLSNRTEFGEKCIFEKNADTAIEEDSFVNLALMRIPPIYMAFSGESHKEISKLEDSAYVYGEYQRILQENALFEEAREYRIREKESWRKLAILRSEFVK
ncbi:pentapeptide repeat-containing protein [Natrinema soli]|uniref:Pentapeptide repeat-containing protein n=1 Tax=Natrinema soli TaxID=1930624 RepID=A0ABD5SXH6_9EURY|nr:pentapeptide repeat-containing protein [Natrinema soli]